MRRPLDRRRFLAVAAGALATGTGGAIAALRGSDPRREPVASGGASTAPTSSSTGATSSTAAPSTSTTPTSTSTTTTTAAPASAGGTRVLCRDAWGAAPPAGALPAHTVDRLTIHHTGVALTDPRTAPARMRGHQRYHQRHGFTDIAYHLVIDGTGNVYEGRDRGQPGETFTDYDPTGHLLVTLEGNFDEQPLPGAQLDALVAVMAWACRHYGIAPDAILSHRDWASTSCPGAAAHGVIADGTLARRVEAAMGADLVPWCGPDAAAHVAAIEAGTA